MTDEGVRMDYPTTRDLQDRIDKKRKSIQHIESTIDDLSRKMANLG